MKLFDCFEVSHLTFCETGFNIDFDNNEIKLTSLEKYKRITLKINEENMEYLKKEIEKWKLQMNHGNSVKYNELYQRINKRIQRQNKDWVEKMSKMLIDIALESIKEYNCEVAIISFENLKEYEAGNNSKKINKKNTEWLRGKIIQRVFEKSLWINSMKILTYLPTFNKNQRNPEQILVKTRNTSIKCSRRGSKGIKRGNEFFCSKCRFTDNIHINASRNIAKRTIEYLRTIASP
jgi:hypothetical protein